MIDPDSLIRPVYNDIWVAVICHQLPSNQSCITGSRLPSNLPICKHLTTKPIIISCLINHSIDFFPIFMWL